MVTHEPTGIREGDIKAALLDFLRGPGRFGERFCAINEMTVDRRTRRVDIAVVHKGLFCFEIKSEADKLDRLVSQTDIFLKYFDKVTVVCASCHLGDVLELMPSHVAVWTYDGLRFKVHRRGRRININDPLKLIRLLQVGELRKLGKVGGFKSSRRRRAELTSDAASLSIKSLRTFLFKSLTERYAVTNKTFWHHVAGHSIRSEDLKLLSVVRSFKKAVERQSRKSKRKPPKDRGSAVPDYEVDKKLQKWAAGRGKTPLGRIPKSVTELINSQ